MEKDPDLFAEAQSIVQYIDEFAGLPNMIQIVQRYKCALGNDYRLELRSHSSTRDDFLRNNDRWIYLSVPHEEQCAPIFSINLTDTIDQREIRGNTRNAYRIGEIREATDSSLEAEKSLIENLQVLWSRYDATLEIDTIAAQALDQFFIKLLSRGATITRSDIWKTHEDGTKVVVHRNSIEGSFQHVWMPEANEPILKIGVYLSDAETGTVLEQRTGTQFETYEEIADPLERVAYYAKEDGVTRNEDGKILFITGDIRHEEAIKEAERAAGLRDLHPGRLSLINKYVQAVFEEQVSPD